jgi:sugar lactone lactonase YvrE
MDIDVLIDGGATIVESAIWSPGERALYWIDERGCDPANGRLGDREVFAEIPASVGLPGGAAIDTDGGSWLALHGGGKIRRYTASGEVDRAIALPVSQPTMCAFAGEDLGDLYVTSASDKLSEEQKRREPLAGAVLCLRPGERRIPRPLFG